MAITRRDFFVKTLQGAVVVAVPAVFSTFIQGCKDNIDGPSGAALDKLQATLVNGVVTLDITSSSSLAKVGGAAIVNYGSGSLLVDHPSDNVYNALSAVCTHQGCSIDNYDSGTSNFVCPCHSSRFAVDGAVVSGPATQALTKYPAVFANNQLKITIS